MKCEQNIHAQVSAIMEMGVLSITKNGHGLINVFTKREANTAQNYDLLFKSLDSGSFCKELLQ
jgi:hypothetical protein